VPVRGTNPTVHNPELILALDYNLAVGWEVEVTDEFKRWWNDLDEA
jgi:hypothetical protein